jgi:hypothetical protein
MSEDIDRLKIYERWRIALMMRTANLSGVSQMRGSGASCWRSGIISKI